MANGGGVAVARAALRSGARGVDAEGFVVRGAAACLFSEAGGRLVVAGRLVAGVLGQQAVFVVVGCAKERGCVRVM